MNKNMFLYSATHKNTAQAVILLRSTPHIHWTSVTLSKNPPDVSSQDHPACNSTIAEVDEMGRNNLKMKFLFVESNKILLWVKFIWKLHFSFYSPSLVIANKCTHLQPHVRILFPTYTPRQHQFQDGFMACQERRKLMSEYFSTSSHTIVISHYSLLFPGFTSLHKQYNLNSTMQHYYFAHMQMNHI